MALPPDQLQLWLELRNRLRDKQLVSTDDSTLSLRLPSTDTMWFGKTSDAEPRQLALPAAARAHGPRKMHAAVYGARADVGAIAIGGGPYGLCLSDFGGTMPQVFDEQARHLGSMPAPNDGLDALSHALRDGGNVIQMPQGVVCLGMTATRLALNAELFEKCAKAYVLATATGGRVSPLPWVVRFVANRRLKKDESRAAIRFSNGLLPEETKGY